MRSERSQNTSQLEKEAAHQTANEASMQKWRFLELIQFDNRYALVVITLSFKMAMFLHLILAYLLLQKEAGCLWIRKYVSYFMQDQSIYRILQAVAYALILALLLAFTVILRDDHNSIRWKVSRKMLQVILPVLEGGLCLSSFLLIVDFLPNALNFVLFGLCSILVSLVGENSTERRVHTYQSSHLGVFLFKLIQILVYFSSSLVVAARGSFQTFFIVNCCISLIILVWYYKWGVWLNRLSSLKYFRIAFISAYCTLILLFSQRIILGSDIFVLSGMLRCILLIGFSLFYWIQLEKSKKISNKSLQNIVYIKSHLKQIDLQFNDLVGSLILDNQNLVMGILKMHEKIKCSNRHCYSHSSACYDAATKTHIEIGNTKKDKQSTVRFYLKCLYEQSIASHQNPTRLMLDYAQFLLNESLDIFLIAKLFNSIELRPLGYLQQIRLFKLKSAARQQSVKLNNLIYNGNLDIESVVIADALFQEICNEVTDYVTFNLHIWHVISNPDVNMSLLKQKIRESFKMADQIGQKWDVMRPYLPYQQRWLFYYQHYRTFIKNQKIRTKNSADFTFQSVKQGQNTYINPEEDIDKSRLYVKSFLFDKNTMYMQAYLQDKTIYILRTNLVFQEISGYFKQELYRLELSKILPLEIQETHDKSVLDWLEKGQSNNDSEYPVTFTELNTKYKIDIPVIKYFKIIVNLHSSTESILSFVCMLKMNIEQPSRQQSQSLSHHQNKDEVINTLSFMSHFSQNEKASVLKTENNPFIKQQIFQPIDIMDELIKLKRSLRLLVLILLGITLGLMILTQANANNLNNYSLQYINFLNLYRYPMAFGKNILKTFMKVGNQTKAINQIHFQVDQISLALRDPNLIQSIFDSTLNLPRSYPPFQNNSFNKGISYNQIDLIYYMASCIQQLNNLPVNRTDAPFVNLNMYIAPSYDQLINSTKIQFHLSFQTVFSSMISNQLIVFGISVAVFAITIIYIVQIMYRQFKKNKECLKTIVQFRDEDVQNIILYFKKIKTYFLGFNSLSPQSIMQQVTRNEGEIELTENVLIELRQRNGEISMNKKNKRIYQTEKQSKKRTRYLIMMVSLIGLVLGVILSFEIANIIVINKIQSFQQDGFYFLRYFPATSVLGHAILERYYNQVYPNEIDFFPQRYAESISDLTLIGHSEYIGKPYLGDSIYFQDQKNYLFGNPCTFNPAVLVAAETTLTKCLTIYNSTFSRGITNFLRASQSQIIGYLNKKINMTSAQVDEITSALTLVAYYITDAIYQWSSEFTKMIQIFNLESGIHCLSICLFLLLFHFAVCEGYLFPHFMADFTFMRRVFQNMVPEEILANEKVIRQKFVANGILRQT